MAAPTKVYAVQIKAGVTAEQLAEVERECALTGSTTSDVIRAALNAYFAKKRRRAS